MKMNTYKIFEKGSVTFFNSSLFFPKKIREDVFKLYAFVRVVDDFIDSTPQQIEKFRSFREQYNLSIQGNHVNDEIIENFVELIKRKSIKIEWVEAFLDSMESDITKKEYATLEETMQYIYGSAEVMGLIMCRIMDLPEDTYKYGQMLGKAFQYINFIRDIEEDNNLGRRYLPMTELNKFNLKNLSQEYIFQNQDKFINFIRAQIEKYREWTKLAEAGFKLIPKRYRIPIKTASDMFNWTADKIEKDPLIIFKRKVKPTRSRIFVQIILNTIRF